MAKRARPAPPVQINVVAEGTVLEGALYVKEDMRISGRVIGTVTAQKRVVVAPEGVIDGEVVAASADVSGSVHGDLDVAEHLVLRSGSRVEGNLKTDQFTVEKGAVFNGTCRMGQIAAPPPVEKVDEVEIPKPPPAPDAEALPHWLDVLVEQTEPVSEKTILPLPAPEPPKWTPAPLKPKSEALDQDEPSPSPVGPLAEEAETLPPHPVEEALPDHLGEGVHQEDESLLASAETPPLPLPAKAAWNGPEDTAAPEQPSSKRGTPVVLGIFVVAVLIVGGYFGLQSMGRDAADPPSGVALASNEALADTSPGEAPITEATLLPAEDETEGETEDVTPPLDEPAEDPPPAEPEPLDDEDTLLDQADPAELVPDDPPDSTEAIPEPTTEEEDGAIAEEDTTAAQEEEGAAAVQEEEDTAAAQAEVVSVVQRLTRHLKASIEGENVDEMDALFYRGWGSFFDEANALVATVRSDNVQVSGTQATVDVSVGLDYMDAEDQRQQSTRSYRWNLMRLSEGWVLMRVNAQ